MSIRQALEARIYGENSPHTFYGEQNGNPNKAIVYKLSRFNTPVVFNRINKGETLNIQAQRNPGFVLVTSSGEGNLTLDNGILRKVSEGRLAYIDVGSTGNLRPQDNSLDCLTIAVPRRTDVRRMLSLSTELTKIERENNPHNNSRTGMIPPIAMATDHGNNLRDNLFWTLFEQNGVTIAHSTLIGEHGERTADSNRILIVNSGNLVFTINGNSKVLLHGDAIFMPAGTVFNFRTQSESIPVTYSAVIWGKLDPYKIPGAKCITIAEFGQRFR